MAELAPWVQPERHASFTTHTPQNMLLLGIALIAAGAALMVAEAHIPTQGVLGASAAAALATGVGLALAASDAGPVTVVTASVAVGLVGAAAVWMLIVKSLAAHRLAVRSGTSALTGRLAMVRTPLAPRGQVLLDGELWSARRWEVE